MGRRGPAPGTGGRPRKSLDEKLLDGKTLSVLKNGDNEDTVPKCREEVVPKYPEEAVPRYPEAAEFLSREQRIELPLRAKEVYERVFVWLTRYGCENYVTKDTVDLYAISIARWVQCEEAVSKAGLLSKHPTTGAPIASTFSIMAREYAKQAVAVWDRIYAVVRENVSGDYSSRAPGADVMEMLLSDRK